MHACMRLEDSGDDGVGCHSHHEWMGMFPIGATVSSTSCCALVLAIKFWGRLKML